MKTQEWGGGMRALALPFCLCPRQVLSEVQGGQPDGQGRPGPWGWRGWQAELQEEGESLPGGDCAVRRCGSFFLLDGHRPHRTRPPLWGHSSRNPLIGCGVGG